MALYVVYAVVSYVITVVINIYIPHCMRIISEEQIASPSGLQQTSNERAMSSTSDEAKIPDQEDIVDVSGIDTMQPRVYGFKMSVFGALGLAAAGIFALVLVIILQTTLAVEDVQNAGLLVTTVVGFVTIVGSVVSYLGLPVVPSKPGSDWKAWWIQLFTPFKDLLQRKNILMLLLSYTIYTDTVFALSSITAQLFFIQVQPDSLENSLYALAGNSYQFVCMVAFFVLQNWRPPFKLEYWFILGYALVLVVPVWGCIGIADNINFGLKVNPSSQVKHYIR